MNSTTTTTATMLPKTTIMPKKEEEKKSFWDKFKGNSKQKEGVRKFSILDTNSGIMLP